ncbi:MAG: SPFH domain-containing protein [Anaerolineae bacterium]
MRGKSGDDAVDATTVDGQTVSLDVTIFYSIDPAKANQVYQRWPRTDPDVAGYSVYIRSTARTVVRDVVATFRADAIYGQGRTAMQQQINDQMAIKLAQEGFNLNAVNVRGLQFSEQFTQAIENKNAADQAAQQAQIVVQQRERKPTSSAPRRRASETLPLLARKVRHRRRFCRRAPKPKRCGW